MIADHGAGADRRQREVLLEIWSRRWSYSKLASIWRRADQDQGAHCATGAQIRVASINLVKVHQSKLLKPPSTASSGQSASEQSWPSQAC